MRVTEGEVIAERSSSALLLLNRLLIQALHQAGHYFTPDSRGVTKELPRLFERLGFQDVQTHLSMLEYRGGTEQSRSLYEDTRHLFRTILPFLQKWTHVPERYEELYHQILDEMQRPDFTTTCPQKAPGLTRLSPNGRTSKEIGSKKQYVQLDPQRP